MAKVNVNTPMSGLNLYLDKKSRLIYYSPILKKAWYIPKFDYKKFERFKARYITILAAFLVSATILKDWLDLPLYVPVLITLAIWIGLEYSFYKFITSLQPVKKFDKNQLQHTYDFRISKDDRTKALLKVGLYLALGILLVVNAYQQHYDSMTLIFCYAAMIACIFYACFLGYQIYRAGKAS